MKSERAQELYTDYAEGALSPAMKLALEQHFEADSAARADYNEFYRVWSLLETPLEEIDVPHGFRAKVMERVSLEQAKRTKNPLQNAMRSLSDWFGFSPQRRTAGAVAATLLVATVIGVFTHSGTPSAGFGPNGISRPVTSGELGTTIQGVTTQVGEDGNLYHMFRVHLPQSVPHAVVNAFVLRDTSEITNPNLLAQDATPALKQPRELQNDEEMQIPVALLSSLPAGTTLNMVVQWSVDNDPTQSGSQVIFTPVTSDQVSTTTAPAASGSFYDALQSIAANDDVTIIADVTKNVPVGGITMNPAITDPLAALKAVTNGTGFAVKSLDDRTYQVYQKTN
jgi:hypothetical protein